LVGNSLGGAIAIRFAATHPERVARLFLLGSAGLHGEAPALLEPASREVARELIEVVSGPGRRTPRFVLDDVVRQARDPARRAALRSGHAEPVDVTADLPRIAAPTTIVWGELDRLIPLENGVRLRDGIAGSELIVLPGVGHVPQVQAPKRVVAIVRERLGTPPR
jgi:pimeloyl-ACP methyl ester carboxylesterase